LEKPVKVPGAGSLMKKAGLVSAFTMLSRVLGLVREQAFAALLGAGMHADAFQIAFRIPNLLRDLFAEGALSAAFVPTYARVLKEEGEERANQVASRLLSLLALVLGAIVLAGLVAAPYVVELLAPGYERVEGKFGLTVLLTRIMLPFLPLVSFAAVAMGILNARERFGVPALAPSMFNVVSIGWALLLWALGLPIEQVAVGWAMGTLLGGLAQFAVQLPALGKVGFRLRPAWGPSDPALRQMGMLMVPATVGLAAVQLNIFISSNFASHEQGAVSWLNYAFRILYLPIGIFGVAVGTIAGSGLARRAAEKDTPGLQELLRHSLRLVGFLSLPATVGLMTLAVPIVRLLYERGRFGPGDTSATAAALVFYGTGLVAYTAVKVLAPAFYALGRPRVPLLASALAVATNIVFILLVHADFGFRAIALGTALGSIANCLVLIVSFQRSVGGLSGHGMAGALARMAAASAVMAPVVLLAARFLEARLGTTGVWAQAAGTLLPVGAGVLAYGAASSLLRVGEMAEVVGAVRRRLGRSR
jgi:putative peptidoglycan lipid II flippase